MFETISGLKSDNRKRQNIYKISITLLSCIRSEGQFERNEMMFGLLINLRLSSTLAGFKFSVNNG